LCRARNIINLSNSFRNRCNEFDGINDEFSLSNNPTIVAEFEGSHSGGYEEFYLPEYYAVYPGESQPTFRRRISLAEHSLIYAGFMNSLLFNPEDRGDVYLRNVGWFSELHSVIFQKIKLFT
jgi:hypothetical protein